MPKLYDYLGISVFFYSNEHDPVHVHGAHNGRESKAEIIIEDGTIVEIRFGAVEHRRMLEGTARDDFETLVRQRAVEIVQKWMDYFVLHRQIAPVVITRRIRRTS